jgi:amino acid transporter
MFIGQIFAVHVMRRNGKHPMPFHMWLYPLPSIVALVGWIWLLASSAWPLLALTAAVYASGLVAFKIRDQLRPPAESIA